MRRLIMRILFLPTLTWNVLLGRVLGLRNWWDRVDDHVLIGALPFASDVPAMQKDGVGAVVNTCEEYAGPTEAYRLAGIEQLRLPTVDFTAPSLEDVERGVEFIEHQIQQGKDVYVHCKAGRARSATVVLCWLIKAKSMTPDQAQQRILERRPHANPRLAKRIVVQEFWQRQTG